MDEPPASPPRTKPLPTAKGLPSLPPAARGDVGRGRGRGRAATVLPRLPSVTTVEDIEEPAEAGASDAVFDSPPMQNSPLPQQRSQVVAPRSPPQVRTWARTGSGNSPAPERPTSVPNNQDRPASEDYKTSPRSVTVMASRHKSAATRLAPLSASAALGTPLAAPLLEAPSAPPSRTPNGSNRDSSSSVIPSPRVLPEPVEVESSSEALSGSGDDKPSVPSHMALSTRTLQRLSKRVSQHDVKRRNDTMRSLDTRVKEALLAGNSEGCSAGDGFGSGASGEEVAEQETNDQVWVWGNRGYDVISHATPQTLPELGSKNVKQVSAGYNHMIMVLENGAVYTWGIGKDGRLGHGKNDADQLLPTRVEALEKFNVKSVAAGGSCSLALTHDGICYYWGWFGVEEAMRFVLPYVVEGLEKQRIVALACGENHAMVLSLDHQVWSWGLNKNGSLGQGRKELEFIATPKLLLLNQEFIACGPYSGASISTKGQLSYWGPHLTKKKEKPFKKPEKFTHKGHLVAVALGGQHMLMLEDTGEVYAVGDGAHGQLGTGHYTAQDNPVKVEFPLSREEKLRLRGLNKGADGGAAAPAAGGSVRPSVPSGGSGVGKQPATAKARPFTKGPGPPPGPTLRDTNSSPAPKQVKTIGAGFASSVAVTKEGKVFVWGKIDSKGTEGLLQPTLVRALDKIAIDQVSVNADQIVALVGLKNERDIRYFSFNPPIVKAATLGKLVDWLMSDKSQHDPLFLYAFFASHDVFASSVDVLDELGSRYERARLSEGSKVQTRLLAVLMQWIKLRPGDFRLPATKKRIEEFLSKMEPAPQRQIRKCIETEESNFAQSVAPIPSVQSKQNISSLVGKCSALDLAQQMALLDKLYFDRIRPLPEMTHQNWMKQAKRDLSPNVLAFIARFNQLFYVIVTDCIAQEQTAVRSARFLFWAECHQHSVAIGNLSAAVCIASALNSVPIRKLAKRDLIVIKPQHRQSLEDFRKLLSDRNKAGYRELLQKRMDDGEPTIPYLATMLSDLTFVEEGNKNTLSDGLIHFYKFHLIGRQLQSVDDLQKRSYNAFSTDDGVQGMLVNATGLDEETCDKVADLICAGESIASLLASAEAKRDVSVDSESGQGSNDKGDNKLDAMVEALDKEAALLRDPVSANQRFEIWNGWLSRIEKEGDEFRALLCSSGALAESVDSMLKEPLKKPEASVFAPLLSKLLSPTANARSLLSLLATLTPLTSVFSDVREEVVKLCVSQEFNALVETLSAGTLKGAPVGFFELAEEEEKRARARAAANLLEGINYEELDSKVNAATESVVNVLALPAVKEACDYASTALEEVMATRESQLDERISTLQQSAQDAEANSELGDGSAEFEHLAQVKEQLNELAEREKELEEALALVREEIQQTKQLLEAAEAAVTKKADRADADTTSELLAKEEAMREAMSAASSGIRAYVDKVLAPRQSKLRSRLLRLQGVAREKAEEFFALFASLKEGLEQCVVVHGGGAKSPWDELEDKKKDATRRELKDMFGKAKDGYAQLESILKSTELEVELVEQIDEVMAECEKLCSK